MPLSEESPRWHQALPCLCSFLSDPGWLLFVHFSKLFPTLTPKVVDSALKGISPVVTALLNMPYLAFLLLDWILLHILSLFPAGDFCEQPNLWLDHPSGADAGRFAHWGDRIAYNS